MLPSYSSLRKRWSAGVFAPPPTWIRVKDDENLVQNLFASRILKVYLYCTIFIIFYKKVNCNIQVWINSLQVIKNENLISSSCQIQRAASTCMTEVSIMQLQHLYLLFNGIHHLVLCQLEALIFCSMWRVFMCKWQKMLIRGGVTKKTTRKLGQSPKWKIDSTLQPNHNWDIFVVVFSKSPLPIDTFSKIFFLILVRKICQAV